MPLVEDSPDSIPKQVYKYLPDWFFDHTWLGYQTTTKGVIIYRLPTLRECMKYHKASIFSPPRACQLFINKIALYNAAIIDELDPQEVGHVVVAILNESFPRDKAVFNLIDEQSALYEGSLVHAMETFTKSVGDNERIWDMNIMEAVERVGLAQMLLGQRMKPDEKETNRTRRQPQRPDQPAGRSNEEGPRDARTS